MNNKIHAIHAGLALMSGVFGMLIAILLVTVKPSPPEVREGSTTVERVHSSEVTAEIDVPEVVIVASATEDVSGPGAARVRPRERDQSGRRLSDVSPKGEGRAAALVEPQGSDNGLLGLPLDRPMREHYSGVPVLKANTDITSKSLKDRPERETFVFETR